jgi:hypothetical protein
MVRKQQAGVSRKGAARPAFIGTALILLTACSGIPFRAKNGTTHYVIVGLGVVSVNHSNQTAAVVTAQHSVGIIMSSQPGLSFSAGYSSGLTTLVPDGAQDVRIEVSRHPFGPITVDIQSAVLSNQHTSTTQTGGKL